MISFDFPMLFYEFLIKSIGESNKFRPTKGQLQKPTSSLTRAWTYYVCGRNKVCKKQNIAETLGDTIKGSKGQFKISYAIVCHLLGYFYDKHVETIGLKAPRNYFDQFWSNKILVLLCQGPKHNVSMISGFVSRKERLFMD